MANTDIEAGTTASTLTEISPDEQRLADAVKGNIDRSKLVLPALKVTNGQTREVQDGKAEQGHLVNSLTGEDYGTEVEFVISALFDGRFYSDDSGSYATSDLVAPSNWPEQFRGKAFADIPEGEERWKDDSNADVHPWGNGPPISTTHNFVGYVVGHEEMPVRLSLMRTGNKAAQKLNTLIFASRAPWDRTYKLSVVRDTNPKGKVYFRLDADMGGITSPDLRSRAAGLAQDYLNAQDAGTVELDGDESDAAPQRERTVRRGNGLGVS